MNSWYVAKSKPHQETLLMASLRKYGVEVFFPRIVRPGTGVHRREPLFPTYVFCRIAPIAPSWPALRWAPGLAYFLGGARGLGVVPDDVVSVIRSKTEEWNQGGYRSSIPYNSRITVTNGPFQGLEGLFQRYLPASERCLILLNIMTRYVEVEVPSEYVKELSQGFHL